jgi:hypothetical protein
MDHETMETEATPSQPAEAPAMTWMPATVEVAEPVGSSRSRRAFAVLAGAALIALTVGASAALASDPSGAPAGGAIPVDPIPVDAAAAEAAFKDFAACMRENGVDMPDPVTVSGGPGVTGTTGTTGVIVEGGAAVALPADGAQPVPFDDAAFKAADAACSPILEAAGISSGAGTIVGGEGTLDIAGGEGAGMIGVTVAGNGDVTKMAEEMKAYAACMRDKGQDVPDPVVDAKAGTAQMQVNGDPSSAAFRAADQACSTGTFGFAIPVPVQP